MHKISAIFSNNAVIPRFCSSGIRQRKKMVVITGCDSGLGYSLSLKCNELGCLVVSGCLDLMSEGAKSLSSRNYVYQVDVRNATDVRRFEEKVNGLIETENCDLHAVVNNAGIMMFGEFEWLTEKQIAQHVEVNLMGTFRVTKRFLPLLRKYKGRLINITSHCSIANLPCLSVYGATKAAVQSWSDSLRIEQGKYGVKIITFLPGSLATQSDIMSRQDMHAGEMEKEFTEEQRDFYLEYFNVFRSYLSGIRKEKRELKPIQDDVLYRKFTKALMDPNPKYLYKHEPLRYFFYYNLFRLAPITVRDYFVNVFTKFPKFKEKK